MFKNKFAIGESRKGFKKSAAKKIGGEKKIELKNENKTQPKKIFKFFWIIRFLKSYSLCFKRKNRNKLYFGRPLYHQNVWPKIFDVVFEGRKDLQELSAGIGI
jgi:hypothetical protein